MKRAPLWLILGVLGGSSMGCGKLMRLVQGLTGGAPSHDTAAQPAATPSGGPEAPEAPASSVTRPAPGRATGCPAMLNNSALLPGTEHAIELHRDEVWSLEDSPHRLPNGFHVPDGKTLTVAPCAVVLLANGTGFHVDNGATLIAVGDAQHPIRFGSNNPQPQPGDWQSLWIDANARRNSRLSHVIVEHAGHEWGGVHAGLVVIAPSFHLDHVAMRFNTGFGLALRDGGSLSSDSSDLVVTQTAAEGTSQTGAVYVQRPPAVATLPLGQYTGNAVDEVLIAEGGTGDDHAVRQSATWRNVGVPYHLADDVDLRVEGPTGPVLTLAPTVTIRMGRNAGISVGYDAEGGLIVDGQSEAGRVTLKPAGNDASPGIWRGVYFGPRFNRSLSRLHFASLQSAGANWNAQLCDWQGTSSDNAFVLFENTPSANALEHVSFANGAPDVAAIARHWRGAAVDFSAPALGNDFTQLGAGCHQSPVMSAEGGCPDPAPACQ